MSGPARQYPLLSLDYAIQEAIDFLRQHEPSEGYYDGFSGGKDSLVTKKLLALAGVKFQPYYSCTRIDPPEMYRFLREHHPDTIWLFPKRSFWDAIQTEWPPLGIRRWCCDVLKKDLSQDIPLRVRVMGMRAEESASRASRPRIDWNDERKQLIIKPIFHWMEWQVWDFIEKYQIPYPKLYDEGWSRIGCVVCPFLFGKNQALINRNKDRWPGIYKTFEHACRRWFEARLKNGKPQKHETFDAWLHDYYKGFKTHEKPKARTDPNRLVAA